MYEPSHDPLGGAIAAVEEEEEEDQSRSKGEEEPLLAGGERGGDKRTVDTRGPVAPDGRCGGCGPAEERGRSSSPEFARESPAKSIKHAEELERKRERSLGARKKKWSGRPPRCHSTRI
jgi:hypothetical protein